MVRMSSHQETTRDTPSGLIGAAALLLTLGGVLLWLVMLSGPVKLGTGLLEASSHLDDAQQRLSAGRFRPAVYQTFAARAAAAKAQQGFDSNSPLMDLATLVPQVDDAMGELDHVLAGVSHATEAASGTLEIGLSALKGPDRIIGPDPDGEGSIILLDRIEELGGVVAEVRRDITAAGEEFAAIDLSKLPKRVHKDIRDGIDRARETDKVLADAEAGFELLPGILGANGPRTYMLGFQNSAELRGSGGAMLQFEFLTIDNGKPELAEDDTGSIYKLDQERRTIDIPLPDDAWYVAGIEDAQRFGNSNWSPDWPLSARLAVEYGRASAERCVPRGDNECPEFPDLDGVLAIDPVVVENLMPGIGPYPQGAFFIKSSTVVDILLNKAYARFPLPFERRGYLGRFVSRLFEKMFDPQQPTELVQAMGTSLGNKNMQINMTDPTEQAFVERMKWDGSIARETAGDYFQVVEQNVGGNKLDYFADQADRMNISIEGRDALHSTSIEVGNHVVLPQPRWFLGDSKAAHRPMLNLYVPPDAELMAADAGELCPAPLDRSCNGRIDAPLDLATWIGGTPPEHTEKGKKVWSGTLQIPPDETGSFDVDYRTPNAVVEREGRNVYRLMVQRQAKFHPERLLVQLKLPAGASKIEAPGFKKDGGRLTLDRRLMSDTVLEVSWRS
ncbi:hypothetical protein BH20ACT23_BH20ACT23_30980 [soil metagenome]